MQSWSPARAGEARVAALPQRSAYNPENPTAPRVGTDPTDADLAPPVDMEDAAIQKAAHDFESYFLSHMLQVMRRTVPDSELFGSGFSKSTYTEMLDQEYANMMSERGMGLGDMLARQLMDQKLQAQKAQDQGAASDPGAS
jgi:Rod binding domain-containing protein